MILCGWTFGVHYCCCCKNWWKKELGQEMDLCIASMKWFGSKKSLSRQVRSNGERVEGPNVSLKQVSCRCRFAECRARGPGPCRSSGPLWTRNTRLNSWCCRQPLSPSPSCRLRPPSSSMNIETPEVAAPMRMVEPIGPGGGL